MGVSPVGGRGRGDMRFEETPLQGVVLIQTEPKVDERGSFSRTYCREELKQQGIDFRVSQCNLTSSHRGVLRGLHFQRTPASEQKIVQCTRGSVYYLVLDLRWNSPTYLLHAGFELSAGARKSLYVAPGFASGSQALEDDTEVLYMMTEMYSPEREGGFRYDDPAFGISWPLAVTTLSRKDAAWPAAGKTIDRKPAEAGVGPEHRQC
jgi:dTDP-4-dehydrorhamnose 3,5-epimerase